MRVGSQQRVQKWRAAPLGTYLSQVVLRHRRSMVCHCTVVTVGVVAAAVLSTNIHNSSRISHQRQGYTWCALELHLAECIHCYCSMCLLPHLSSMFCHTGHHVC